MTISVLLRLVPETLKQGRVTGHAEIVDTGESVLFKDQDEMLAFLRRASAGGPSESTVGSASSGEEPEPWVGGRK